MKKMFIIVIAAVAANLFTTGCGKEETPYYFSQLATVQSWERLDEHMLIEVAYTPEHLGGAIFTKSFFTSGGFGEADLAELQSYLERGGRLVLIESLEMKPYSEWIQLDIDQFREIEFEVISHEK